MPAKSATVATAESRFATWAQATPQEFILAVNTHVEMGKLRFDVECTHGQIRGIDEAHMSEVKDSFVTNPPADPYTAVLIEADDTGMIEICARPRASLFLFFPYRR